MIRTEQEREQERCQTPFPTPFPTRVSGSAGDTWGVTFGEDSVTNPAEFLSKEDMDRLQLAAEAGVRESEFIGQVNVTLVELHGHPADQRIPYFEFAVAKAVASALQKIMD